MPPRLIGWSGSEVRLEGLVLGTSEHGYSLVGERCRGSVAIALPSDAPLFWQLEKMEGRGLVRLDGSGTILSGDPEESWLGKRSGDRFWITSVYRVHVLPMSAEAIERYWNDRFASYRYKQPPS